MSSLRFRPLYGLIGLSLALIPVADAQAGESILKVGSKSVTIPDGNGAQDSAEKQDAIAKLAFMQNYDKTGKAFTMSLPPWARPVKEFIPGVGLSDSSAAGPGSLLSYVGAPGYAFGMGTPRMGMSAPAGVHQPMMVTSALTMQEDVPKITFESCVRMKLNSGIGLETAFQMCQSVNSGYQAPAIPKRQSEQAKAPDTAAPAEQNRTVTQTALSAPASATGSTGWIPSAQEQVATEVATVEAPKGRASGYAGSECDVSRDPSVMLSQECLSRADSLLEGSMAQAGASALHVPLSMQPGQAAPDGRHSLLANIAPRPVPPQEVNFASVDVGRMIRQNTDRSLSGPERQVGSISCDWAINGVSFVGVQYGHGRNGSVKACIQSALASASIDTGTIGISLKDQAHGLNLTVVECHRRNGRDTCGVIR